MKLFTTFTAIIMAILLMCGFTTETGTTDSVSSVPDVVAENTLSMPTISFSSEPTNVSITISITTTDQLDDNARVMYKIGEGEWLDYTAPFIVTENGEVSAKVISGSNFQSPVALATVSCIDRTPPEPPTINADMLTWARDSITVSLEGGSDAQSGFLRCEYKLGAAGEWVEYYNEFTVTDSTVVYARSVDTALNYSAEVSTNISNFDKTAPDVSTLSITFGNDAGANLIESTTFGMYFREEIICSIDGASDGQSGVAYYEYQLVKSGATIDNLKWTKYDVEKKIRILDDFIGFVYVRAYDNAGNVSAPVSSSGVVLDSTPPVIADVTKSTTKATSGKVTITFSVKDNISVDSISVNDVYVGVFAPQFTAYRNGEYKITAKDKAGNSVTHSVYVDNIQTTPYNILKLAQSLDEEDYTPTSWAKLQQAITALNNVLTVESSGAIIDSSAEQLLQVMEALVSRGDGTASRELLERVSLLDENIYTSSSWKRMQEDVLTLNTVLENAESSQLDVDTARRALELSVTELVSLGNFTSLDRVLERIEALDRTLYPQENLTLIDAAVAEASALDRADTSQEEIDRIYNHLLALLSELRIDEEPVEEDETYLIYLLIVGIAVLAIAVLIAIIMVCRRTASGSKKKSSRHSDQGDDPAFYYESSSRVKRPASGTDFGDIHFGDEGEYSEWGEE